MNATNHQSYLSDIVSEEGATITRRNLSEPVGLIEGGETIIMRYKVASPDMYTHVLDDTGPATVFFPDRLRSNVRVAYAILNPVALDIVRGTSEDTASTRMQPWTWGYPKLSTKFTALDGEACGGRCTLKPDTETASFEISYQLSTPR